MRITVRETPGEARVLSPPSDSSPSGRSPARTASGHLEFPPPPHPGCRVCQEPGARCRTARCHSPPPLAPVPEAPVLSFRSCLSKVTCLLLFPSGSSASSSPMWFFPSQDSRVPVSPGSLPVLSPGGLRLPGLPSPPLPMSISWSTCLSGFPACIALRLTASPSGSMKQPGQNGRKG